MLFALPLLPSLVSLFLLRTLLLYYVLLTTTHERILYYYTTTEILLLYYYLSILQIFTTQHAIPLLREYTETGYDGVPDMNEVEA